MPPKKARPRSGAPNHQGASLTNASPPFQIDSEPTITLPLYASWNEMRKRVLAEKKARHSQIRGRKPEKMVFLACYLATIDYVQARNTGQPHPLLPARPDRLTTDYVRELSTADFSLGYLTRAVRKMMEARKEWLRAPAGQIAVPHNKTIKDLCRAWLIWRAVPEDSRLNLVSPKVMRPKVREALQSMKRWGNKDCWNSRYVGAPLDPRLTALVTSTGDQDLLEWVRVQSQITQLVRTLSSISKYIN